MTYSERQKQICEECGQPETCGYVSRGLQSKCLYLQNVMYGWELGQKDTLDAVETCVDKGNSAATEEFMNGLKQFIEQNYG